MLCFVTVNRLRLTMLPCTLLSVFAVLFLLLIFKSCDTLTNDSFVVQWAILQSEQMQPTQSAVKQLHCGIQRCSTYPDGSTHLSSTSAVLAHVYRCSKNCWTVPPRLVVRSALLHTKGV